MSVKVVEIRHEPGIEDMSVDLSGRSYAPPQISRGTFEVLLRMETSRNVGTLLGQTMVEGNVPSDAGTWLRNLADAWDADNPNVAGGRSSAWDTLEEEESEPPAPRRRGRRLELEDEEDDDRA